MRTTHPGARRLGKSSVILLCPLPLALDAICRPCVQECLEFVNRGEEIVHVLALVFQIPRDPSGVRDRLFRKPLARFLPEFRRLRPFHSLSCHRVIPSDDCQPEFVSRVLSPIVTTHRALTNCRLSTARALAISISHPLSMSATCPARP